MSKEHGFTFMNGGTSFSFQPFKQVGQKSKNTMVRLHAQLTLDALRTGKKDVFLVDPYGNVLEESELLHIAKSGRVNRT